MESLSVSEAKYNKLETQYKELIWREANRCFNGLPPTAKAMYGEDGLYNEGCIVLAKIAGKFDPERATKFITLLTTSLKNRFGSINTGAFRLKRGGKSQAISLEDVPFSEEPSVEIDETGLLIADLSGGDKTTEIIVRGFLQGETKKDICSRTGLPTVIFTEKFKDLETRGRELFQTGYNFSKEDDNKMSPTYKPGERVKIGDRDVQVPECYGDCDTGDAECSQCVVKENCATDTAPPESKPEKKSRRKLKPPVEKTEENSKPKPTRRSRRKSKAQTEEKPSAPPVTEKPSRRKKKTEETKAPEKKSRKKTETKVPETKAPETKAPEKKSRKKTETKAPEKKSRKKSTSKPKPVDGDGPSRRWRPSTGGTGGFFYTLTEGERAIATDLVSHIENKPFLKVEHYHDRLNVKGPSQHGFLKLFELQVINGRLEANMRTPSQEILDLAAEKDFDVTTRAHDSFGFPLLTKKLGLAFRQLFKLRLDEMVSTHKRT